MAIGQFHSDPFIAGGAVDMEVKGDLNTCVVQTRGNLEQDQETIAGRRQVDGQRVDVLFSAYYVDWTIRARIRTEVVW
jgi:hypothetical protein